MYKHIAVAADESPAAKNAFHHARKLAEQLGAALTILHVADPAKIRVTAGGGPSEGPDDGFVDVVTGWCNELPGKVAVPPLVALEGTAGHAIPNATVSMRWDLLVVGTRQHDGRMRGLVGSVADEILRRSVIPVLIVRLVE